MLGPGDDHAALGLGADDDIANRVEQGQVAGDKAVEQRVRHVLLDVRVLATAHAVDAQEDGRPVLVALEVDVQGAEGVGGAEAVDAVLGHGQSMNIIGPSGSSSQRSGVERQPGQRGGAS